jgi:hypothetical protein
MERLRVQPAHTQIPRETAPASADCPSEHEELRYEELDERLAPGSGIFCVVKKTAGWGC